MFSDSSITMKLLRVINDTDKVYSIKNMTRQKRSSSSTNFFITGFEQNKSQGNKWQELLNNSECKDQLIEITKQCVLEFGSGILPRSPPFIITSRDKEYFTSPAVNHVISGCNHEDAVTRLVLHDSKVDTNVVVIFKDTDVLILMIWAYSRLNITNN